MRRGLLCAILLGGSTSAWADCRDNWICVETISLGDDVALLARNLADYPITFTLKVRDPFTRNRASSSVTRTLAPRQSEHVIEVDSNDLGGSGKVHFSYEWTVGDKNAEHDDDHLYALPYKSGNSYRVLQGYGSRFSHTGLEEFAIDFDMRVGTAVHAARAGVVARVEESHSRGCWEDGCGAYANYVVILHNDGTTGEYYHLRQNGALVEVGDRIAQGQKIAYSGNTGHTTMPHLHFAVYRATTGGNTQSIPVRFQSSDGIITRPRRGGRYPAM